MVPVLDDEPALLLGRMPYELSPYEVDEPGPVVLRDGG